MTDKILPFTGNTVLDSNPDDILEANKGKFEGFILIGYDHNGEERLISTTSDSALIIWWLERAKKTILESADPYEDWEL